MTCPSSNAPTSEQDLAAAEKLMVNRADFIRLTLLDRVKVDAMPAGWGSGRWSTGRWGRAQNAS